MNPGWRSNYLRYKSYFLNVVGRYRDRADVMAYLEILLSLTTISLFSIFALRPTLLTIGGLTREIDSKEEVLLIMTDKIKGLSQAQSLYDRQRAKIVLLKSAIPTEPQPEIFMRQILGISDQSGVEIIGISTGGVSLLPVKANSPEFAEDPQVTTTEQTGQEGLMFSIQTRSSLEQFLALNTFLTQIEKLRRPVGMTNLSLSVTTEKEQKSLIMGITGTLPYLGP